ncbi:TonB-dependent receptor domain-containing protein [Chitinophaga sp. sic0106]|uniref:TonB-dependent receptor domain-containing protein n=1 Tax=Chitinophaga sp. sic0106 TaxID=2854785 RepID=UPI001C477AE1|nr:outer membrane beta-barrel family protein [Chitinophaga sp. sic0106]MBV7530883.1 TonB-dependent receptor [Chitinophaga sp. sic0106]
MQRIILFLLWLTGTTLAATAQQATVSGIIKDAATREPMPFVNISLLTTSDTSLVKATITAEQGRFQLQNVRQGSYLLMASYLGYQPHYLPVRVGELNPFLDLGTIALTSNARKLNEVTIAGKAAIVSPKMDKKTFSITDNVSQTGGSVLAAMKNLPGITVTSDGKLQLRGSEQVMVLVDGQQTALTGFGGQSSLDNIPASAIDRIEIINNPSARYDANGNAGIINIIYKKEKKEGFNGKAGITTGLGALWIKQDNYPGIRPQYQRTPKVNPSLSLNYRKGKVNFFLQGDYLYNQTLNKNEFVDRFYEDGTVVKQQTKRNRTTNVGTLKAGADWNLSSQDNFSVSALYTREHILDRGDEPFFNKDLSQRLRLWQFLEDEMKTTFTASTAWQHRFAQPGRVLNAGFNYTFHREDEKYFFTNFMPAFIGLDSFKLLSDEHVADFNLDYIQPLHYGRFETGVKFRKRSIPVNMQFKPGENSPLDVNAGGWADYSEVIPAVYGNYILEKEHVEVEAGLRVEYVKIDYKVNPNHPTYKSDGYEYTQPFPNLRLAYKLNEDNKFSLFYNRRVDRPNEVDIRIFPKYDDAEIIKVGNPGLRPQYTNTFELAYKTDWSKGFLSTSIYHKRMDATITRIASTVPGSTLIYNIFQNAGKSYNTGTEMLLSHQLTPWATLGLNLNGYQHIMDAFTVVNLYPVENTFSAPRQSMFSGNVKLNGTFHFPHALEGQLTAIYQAPDLVPQGKTYARFSIDMGVKKGIQHGRGELFANVTDVANTLVNKKEVNGNGFRYVSTDYYETQVLRVGYSYKF